METANRGTWNNIPIDNPRRIGIELHFNEREFRKLSRGLIPHAMEDKWFIFYEEGWLCFHRSWTGFGIYKAEIARGQEGYVIKEFQAERNPEKYKVEDDDADREMFLFLIYRGLLGRDVAHVYSANNIKNEADTITGWSNFGNMLYTGSGLDYSDLVRAALFGVAVGDALGVPVEFSPREKLKSRPVRDMTGYGTHNLPAGTWSDDSSMTFCLAEALSDGYDIDAIGKNFVRWYYESYWTPLGRVFDIGNTIRDAIERIRAGKPAAHAGSIAGSSNGNGSLMRILPLLFHICGKTPEERFKLTKQVSSVTHRHIRSVIACFYYLEFAREIISGKNKFETYRNFRIEIPNHLKAFSVKDEEVGVFHRLLDSNIHELPEERIKSSGYVVDTLEASIWCLLTTDSYEAAVLKAVNLGEDTDTTGAVTGGLAGLLYGIDSIPERWMRQIARYDDIDDLAERLAEKI